MNQTVKDNKTITVWYLEIYSNNVYLEDGSNVLHCGTDVLVEDNYHKNAKFEHNNMRSLSRTIWKSALPVKAKLSKAPYLNFHICY